ncbi:hypothetical protein CKM354_000682800 [Cercospora kikuchii]|uniref:2EXR domain-containing protein n=1 Tax=Cercospora kikuchii TaxID=84275 RepID=A0A9P3CIT5_9PEZI|nr:uncharacterized protein CKM354_000682800 [Cercospora kikuchii]GIZ43609.1 hypothetical protein CKM354_000682800 [Cercospora kikuchii]
MSTEANDHAGPGLTGSPFSKLPAELRNRIWELAVVNEQPLEVSFTFEPDDEIAFSLIDKSTSSLLVTCKQVRDECASMFYNRNTFRLRSGNPSTTNDSVWRKMSIPVVQKFRFINTTSTRQGVTRIIFVAPRSRRRDYADFDVFDFAILAYVYNSMQAAYDGQLLELVAEIYMKLPEGIDPKYPKGIIRVIADVPSMAMHTELGDIVSEMFEDGYAIDDTFARILGSLGLVYEEL